MSEMLEYYGRRAAEYERVYQKPERQADLAILRRELPRLLEGADILEVACGTGYWTEVIAPVAASVVATDGSPETLELARAKRYPPGRVRFAAADAYRVDEIEGRFTAAFAGFWWSHVPKRKLPGFLRDLYRRLEPGSRVLFVDNRYVQGSSTPMSRVDEYGDTYQRRRLRDGSTHEVLKNFPTAEEIRAVVAPFADHLEIVELTYYWYFHCRTPRTG